MFHTLLLNPLATSPQPSNPPGKRKPDGGEEEEEREGESEGEG